MDYTPQHGFVEMTKMNFVWGILGIVGGLITNNLLVKFFNEYYKNCSTAIKILIETLVCSIILGYVHVNINNYFGWTWQNLTPGLFFISCYFSVQYDLFTNLSEYSQKRV